MGVGVGGGSIYSQCKERTLGRKTVPIALFSLIQKRAEPLMHFDKSSIDHNFFSFSLCIGAVTSAGPVCLSDLLSIYTPSRELQDSADSRTLCIPLATKS